MKLSYKEANPEHVKFQRIMMGWLAIASLFLHDVDLIWIFFAITVLGVFTGTELSLPTLFYKFFQTVFRRHLVRITSHHLRYYQINTSMDFIDHFLRLVASSAALGLYYSGFEIAAWLLMSFLSIFMMLSAYFGFCLSALTYIALENLREKLHIPSSRQCVVPASDPKRRFNENCTLAKRCFTPYQRCDSCHINISKCLGTKYNTLMLVIGILLSLFLFIDNHYFIQINILAIMALLFWLGYQINYNTDALTESNDSIITLNKQLKMYAESLEDEVKRRTAEIEHLATHDILTGLFNRFSFEKLLLEAHTAAGEKRTSHLAFIDLDKFKHINDTAGHLAGDKLLRDISSILIQTVGDKGSVARLGGDEFAILFQEITQNDAAATCQSICDQAASYSFVWDGQTFGIGTSIGLATLDNSMQDIKAVLHHADQACYAAKKSGRNRVSLHQRSAG